jgi:uncharacterized protein with von Willebrand factor type A (vWA) domain
MSVYRKHPRGIWWEYDVNKDKIWQKYGIAHIGMWIEVMKLYKTDKKASDIINAHVSDVLDTLMTVDEKYDSKLFEEALKKYPDTQKPFITYLHKRLEQKTMEFDNLKSELLKVGDERNALAHQNDKIIREFNEISNGRTWRMRAKAHKAIKKREK